MRLIEFIAGVVFFCSIGFLISLSPQQDGTAEQVKAIAGMPFHELALFVGAMLVLTVVLTAILLLIRKIGLKADRPKDLSPRVYDWWDK